MATQLEGREYEIPSSLASNVVIEKIRDFTAVQAMNPAIPQQNRIKAFNTMSFIKAIPSEAYALGHAFITESK